jgi:hypothetical protein
VAPSKVKLATLRSAQSLRVTFSCRLACAAKGRLTLSAKDAKRYGLSARTIGSASRSLTKAGSGVLTVRLTTRAKQALRRARNLTATLRITLVGDGAASVVDTKKIAVRR